MDRLICSVQVYFQDYVQSSENKQNTFRIEQSMLSKGHLIKIITYFISHERNTKLTRFHFSNQKEMFFHPKMID